MTSLTCFAFPRSCTTLALLLLTACLSAPLYAQEAGETVRLDVYTPEGDPKVQARALICPGDVAVGSEPLKINFEVTTTNPNPVQYVAVFSFSNETLAATVTSDTHGDPTPVVDGGTTTYTVEGALSNTMPFRVEVVTVATVAGPAETAWEVRRAGVVTQQETCTFEVTADGEGGSGGDLALVIEAIQGALAFDAEAKAATLPLGGEVTICVRVTNDGPDEATEVVITGGADPAVFELQGVTLEPEIGTCSFDQAGGFFSCPGLTLAAGASVKVNVRGVGVAETEETGFSASTGHPNDPDFSNNDDVITMSVGGAQTPGVFTVFPASVTVPANESVEFDGYDCPEDENGEPDFGPDGIPGTDDDACVLVPPSTEWSASSGIGTVDPAIGSSTTFTAANLEAGETRSGAVIARIGADIVFSNVLVEGPPVVANDVLYIDPDEVTIPMGGMQDFSAFDCPLDVETGNPDVGPDGEPGTDDDDCTPKGVTFLVNGNIGTISSTTGSTTTLSATLPEGSTSETGQVIATSDDQTASADVTVVKTGAILGAKWADLDLDGNVDPDEPRLEGWTIYVDLNKNGMLDGDEPPAVTDASGRYGIGDLPPGTYVVREVSQEGFTQTYPRNPDQHTVIVAEGTFVGGVSFSNRLQSEVPQGSIHGQVFEDKDGDGNQIDGENGRDGVVVELRDSEGSLLATTTTRSKDLDGDGVISLRTEAGLYSFDFLEAGNYRVGLQTPPDFLETIRPPPTLSLVDGERVEDQDFGLLDRTQTYSVRGRKFLDQNGNGRRDEGEEYSNGWVIQLAEIGPNDRFRSIATMETADIDGEPGSFRFDGLKPFKSYVVHERQVEGFYQTAPFSPRVLSTVDPEVPAPLDNPQWYMFSNPPGKSLDFGNQRVALTRASDVGDGETLREVIEGCNTRDAAEPPCEILIEEVIQKASRTSATTIRPTRPLPPITRPLVLNGGGNVILDGSAAGPDAHGLVLTAGRTDISGLTITGFSGHGVLLDGEGRNRLTGNTITASGGDGVRVVSGAPNLLLGNSVYANGGLALDVGGDGPTPNDAGEQDGVQNHPMLTAVTLDADTTVVEGTLTSTPDAVFTLEFFASRACTGAGRGEGATFLGATFVLTDAQGQAAVTVRFDTVFAERHFITATATSPAGDTSEVSPCDAAVATGIEITPTDEAEIPAAFRLYDNYPNPFNPETTIRFDVPYRVRIRLEVFNVLGQVVATLVDEEQAAGRHHATFAAGGLPSGIYIYRLTGGAFTETRPMILLK